MDVRVPQVAHADNLDGVSCAQNCRNGKLLSAGSLDWLHCVGKISKTASLSVTEGDVKSLMLKLLWSQDLKCQGLAFHQKNCQTLSTAPVYWACWDLDWEGFSSSLLQLGNERPKHTWVSDADLHVSSSSSEADGALTERFQSRRA